MTLKENCLVISSATDPALRAVGLAKTFTLHAQGGIVLPVFDNIELTVNAGECVCLVGPSGAGKSTLLRSLYANYKPDAGKILVVHRNETVDLLAAEPWEVVEIRRSAIGYVSQFLRVIPRVPALDVVAGPAIAKGIPADQAKALSKTLLTRLNIPERLWPLAPATFSGGEQQRVNIARGFVVDYPIILLDEPTASLDAANRATVVDLITEAKARGAAIVGIFHDEEVRRAVADRLFAVA
ncbi:phosphonate C-P lyase system protein PhnL [Mesorhizobium japonicum R7A]|uniref:Phosphonate C-P lyase system protein PhnL n=3 Tax=Mesorhizobium TaxID=68287 RepID=A0A6M7WYA9_RHILI|nr:phosphonate C-P lyase system protein PhnL [Mesorhizobium japonicum R7A]QJF10913.1 phosphonate C-P lyase system protein PhnL [Mesorhizobium japonicum]QKD05813.1 phosphonate C-P lyase system protein PhnL [Mesorhizobium loti R88b]QJF04844.1 phosphonate C-P lyase system protein PhnL [Mesorhizobium japonicum R7A]QJI86786.1 phosphonate C-P lyase system protein PhnL [Mesorhizobium japonicum]